MTPTPETTALAPTRVAEPTMEVLKYKEELAAKMGLPSPYAMGLMKELAIDLVSSGMVPKHFAQNPMAVYGAAMRGREMELQPMESIFETFWSAPGGNLGMYAKKMLQLMHRGGVTSKFLVESADECQILFTPPSPHEPYTAKFTAAEAKTAGLDKPDSNWAKWRTDMNRARAISRGYRSLMGTFGKLSTFGGYSKEEIEDSPELSTGEATDADAQRMEVLQAKYHVGLKADASAAPDAPAQANPAAAAPEPDKPKAAKKDKAADKVVTMPAAPAPRTNGVAAAAAVAADAPAPAAETATTYLIYYRDREGGISRMTSETPQLHLDTTRLRAMALANQTGGTYYVYPAVDGVVNPDSDALFTAAPPAAPANPAAGAAPAAAKPISTLKQRLLDITAMVTKITNDGLAADKLIPEKTIAARVKTFFLGYFAVGNLKDLPPDTPENAGLYASCFADLDSCARRDANVLLSAPEDTGKRMAADTVRLGGLLNGELRWHPDNVELGFQFARLRGMEHGDMITFLENSGLIVRESGGGWKCAPNDDIRAALSLCLVTRQAGRFIRESNAYHMSIAKALEFMEERRFSGKKISEMAVADVEKAIEWAMTAIKEKVAADAKRDTPPPAAKRREEPAAASAPPAAQAESDQDDLFDALP